jgi:hypothetical protein
MRLDQPFRLPALAAVAVVMTGCYTYTPVGDALRPVAGTTVQATLTDRGRVALEQSLGPEVWQVEGMVRTVSDSTVEMSVHKTVTISRASTRWTGEPVTLRREHYQSMRERQLSRGRTFMLAGSLSAGVVAFVATRSLFGFGAGNDNPPGGPENPPGGQ